MWNWARQARTRATAVWPDAPAVTVLDEPQQSTVQEKMDELSAAMKQTASEAASQVYVALVLVVATSVTVASSHSWSPTDVYVLRAPVRSLSPGDVVTWVGALLAGIITLNVAFAARHRDHNSVAVWAAQRLWSQTLMGATRTFSILSLTVAAPSYWMVTPERRDFRLTVLAVALSIVALALTSTMAPLAREEDQAELSEHRAQARRARIDQALKQVGASSWNLRRRLFTYIAWGAVTGVVATVLLLVVFAASGVNGVSSRDVMALLGYAAVTGFFSAATLNLSGYVYAQRLRYPDWTRAFNVAYGCLLMYGLYLLSLAVFRSASGLERTVLVILVVAAFFVPWALAPSGVRGRGPAAVVAATARARWNKQRQHASTSAPIAPEDSRVGAR